MLEEAVNEIGDNKSYGDALKSFKARSSKAEGLKDDEDEPGDLEDVASDAGGLEGGGNDFKGIKDIS